MSLKNAMRVPSGENFGLGRGAAGPAWSTLAEDPHPLDAGVRIGVRELTNAMSPFTEAVGWLLAPEAGGCRTRVLAEPRDLLDRCDAAVGG